MTSRSTVTRRSAAVPGALGAVFATLLPDKGYSSEACRQRGTQPIILKPKTSGIKGVGQLSYVVEQTFALLHQLRRRPCAGERRLDRHDSLACAVICWRRLMKAGRIGGTATPRKAPKTLNSAAPGRP